MSAQRGYWQECISLAADECGLTLTADQVRSLAESVEGGHENYGMAFYSPPASDRYDAIEREWKAKYERLQKDFDKYQGNAETAQRNALEVARDHENAFADLGYRGRSGGARKRMCKRLVDAGLLEYSKPHRITDAGRAALAAIGSTP